MKINSRGYWENPTAEGHGHDTGLARALSLFFEDENAYEVLDMGCGDGYYLNYFNKFSSVHCDGVDGNPYTVNLVKYPVYIADLSQPLELGAKYDWVLSLEVGEHIPPEYESVFMENMDKHNKDGIVLSWAIRGQGGDGHINCKNNDEIIPIVCSMGYNFDELKTQELRNECATYPDTGWWFRQTVLVFRRKS